MNINKNMLCITSSYHLSIQHDCVVFTCYLCKLGIVELVYDMRTEEKATCQSIKLAQCLFEPLQGKMINAVISRDDNKKLFYKCSWKNDCDCPLESFLEQIFKSADKFDIFKKLSDLMREYADLRLRDGYANLQKKYDVMNELFKKL